MTWPDFIVIGAPRSGTTSLHSYLGEHPRVHMSRIKEPNYFLFDGDPPRFGGPGGEMTARDSIHLERDYRALFEEGAGATARGESSPKYLSTPGTAGRIAGTLPDVKLLAILRNPVDRALSDFALRVRDGWEPCATLEEALEDEPKRLRENWSLGLYLERGFYARQLAEYFDAFPAEQIRIYLHEDLHERSDWLFEDIFEFLGVDAAFRPKMEETLNVSGSIRNPLLRTIWTRTNPVKDLLRPLLPRRVRRSVSNYFITRPKRKLESPPSLRARLLEEYRADMEKLQEMIGRDLSGWLDPDRARPASGRRRAS